MNAAGRYGARGSLARPKRRRPPWSAALQASARRRASLMPWLLFSYLLCFCLVGCSGVQAVQLATSRNYVLLRTQGGSSEVLEDDAPLYAEFQSEVLTDPYLAMLVSLFEATTTAYASANRAAPVPATAANHLMIVLDTAAPGTLYNLQAHYHETNFEVELALGLGNRGQVDLAWAQEHMAGAMGPLLWGLAGLPATGGEAAPGETTTPEIALYRGFSLALEATHAQNPDVQARWRARAQESPEARAQLERTLPVVDNGYRFLDADGQPTLQLRSRAQALRTPGTVATFFTRLLERAGNYYPQRYLLWFFGYSPDQVPYAKVLLALDAVSTEQALSVPGFVEAYARTFPAEREMILDLEDEVFGQVSQ